MIFLMPASEPLASVVMLTPYVALEELSCGGK
jgi:hypothetical protein